MLRKVYIRHREGVPENTNLYAAYEGFRQLGVELAIFEGFGDVGPIAVRDLSPEVGLCGYVGDVLEALRCMNVPLPEPLDYPVSLTRYLRREPKRTTMGAVRNSVHPVFVKPIAHKEFTGLIYRKGDPAARRAVVNVSSDCPVWVCDGILPPMSEYRVFVLDREIVGVKHYKGDWEFAPERCEVESAVRDYSEAPAAYALDFGVYMSDGPDRWTPDHNNSVLIEANDAFALGSYGLEPVTYAKMISARWEELTR